MIAAFLDTVMAAQRTLRISKLRSALTLLGIVIGVVAVVAMAGVIEGMRRKIDHDLEQLGSGVFQVQKQPQGGFGPRDFAKFERRKDFTLRDVDLLQHRCKTCLLVGGEAWESEGQVSSTEKTVQNSVMVAGATEAFFPNNGFTLGTGRFITESEARSGANVAVIGSDIVDVLYAPESPLDKWLVVRGRRYKVVGTLAQRGQQMGGSYDNVIALPIAAFLPAYGAQRSLNVTIAAADPTHIGRTQDEVVALLRQARGVAPEDENDFEMFSNESVQETFAKITGMIAATSVGVCAIALLIGGIGVMNIMLVSVTERTSEIGLRRALGARRRRVLMQFLVEAIMLTLVGGAVGVVTGWGLAKIISVLVNIPTAVPTWAVMLSMISSGSVGLVFGMYPAYRASRLDPANAMRRD